MAWVEWQAAPEMNLEVVRGGDFLVIRRPELLEHLAAPWPETQQDDEVMLELKLAGNHLDRAAVDRALLRRQGRQVQRLEEDAAWLGEEPLWLVTPHIPEWLHETRRAVSFGPGCYHVEAWGHGFVWMAANELPLVDELIPFLMARSGQALDELGRWIASRPPLVLGVDLVRDLPMWMPTGEPYWRSGKIEDPEIEVRRRCILETLLEPTHETRRQLIEQARQAESRATAASP